jgi:hypothetical protein
LVHEKSWCPFAKGRDHLVVGQKGLQEQSAITTPRTEQAGGAHHECHHLFSGPIPRGQQFTIHIQKRDNIGGGDSVQSRLGTNNDICRNMHRFDLLFRSI